MRFSATQFKHVLRRLMRSPMFTAITLITPAVGIGANTAIFSVVSAVLLKPLPYPAAGRLVGIWETAPGVGMPEVNASPATYFTFREEGRAFEDSGLWQPDSVSITGIAEPEQVEAMNVTDGTLPVLGVQPVLGRWFTRKDDSPGSPHTVVLNWGSAGAAIGKRIRETPKAPWREIIGIVGNERDNGADQKAPTMVYWPLVVKDLWSFPVRLERTPAFAIRSSRAGSASFLKEVRQAVWSANPELPIADVRTVQEIYAKSMARTSFTLVMLAIAAGMAVLLGVVGIYGIISYSVSQRTAGGIGVASSLAAAIALTRLMTALLFEVSPLDPLTCAAVSLVLLAAAWLATYVPARRATTIEPVEALRAE